MQPPHGIEPREGAELSKRVSVCQRSSQGAQAPQRSARAERGRDSLPRHLELTRTSAKGSFSFIEGSAEIASRNLASEWDAFSALRPLGKARPGIRRQNGMCFPFAVFGGNCVPDPALRTGCIFRLRPRTENASQSFAKNGMRFPALTSDVRAHLGAPARAHLSQTFLPLLRHFVDRSVACLHARVYSNR